MISYRFKRRAFLAGIGGGVGLKIMLRNVEAVAQGATKSPARLLLSHWPVGIVAGSSDSLFTATSPGARAGRQASAVHAAGPGPTWRCQGNLVAQRRGRQPRGGTPALMTGVGCAGTRSGQQESDDGYAAGRRLSRSCSRSRARR